LLGPLLQLSIRDFVRVLLQHSKNPNCELIVVILLIAKWSL
jgi:hypothetical protein